MPESEVARFPFPKPSVPYDPAAEVRDVMAKCPVSEVRFPDDSTAWLITGFSETREVLVDQRFSRALVYAPGRALTPTDAAAAGSILAMDPPEHTRLRKLVAGAFTVRRIQDLRPQVREIVDDLITAMLAGPKPADLVSQFSLIFPSSVICRLLGVPLADSGRFQEWTSTMLGDVERPVQEILQAQSALAGYMSELIARKREEPADDLISLLVNARDSEGRLSEEELVTFCIILLAAGYETTANMTSLAFMALCQNPEQLDRLRADPELIPDAVEELLRYVTLISGGIGGIARITREEVCLGGVTIPAGETVIPAFNYANRDPSAFEDPDRLDVGREPQSHLAFGAGVHHCLGAQLARLELAEAFRGLLTRLPGLRMAGSMSEVAVRAGQAITSVRELPVTWDDTI